MRILFFSDNFKPETCPPATHVYERVKLWASWGHEVTVITTAPNFPEGKLFPGYTNRWRTVEDMDGVRVVRVKTFISRNKGIALRTLDFMSYVMPAVLAALRELRPDIVISTSPQLFTPVAGVLFSRLRRVPHVFELRDIWPASIVATGTMKAGWALRMLERLELKMYRESARILSITRSYVKELTSRGVDEKKIDVVLNGTDLDLFTPRPKDQELVKELLLEGRFVVGYLGTLGLAHGLENVLRSARHLRNTNITFLFVGGGADREKLVSLSKEMELDNVLFVPRQDKAAMPRYNSVCDVSLVHLRNSPLFATVIPSKIFDSMAMGIPILFVGPPGEASSLVDGHRAGVTVPPDDPWRLARAVDELASDSTTLATCARMALEAAPLYSRDRHASETIAVLRRALESMNRAELTLDAPSAASSRMDRLVTLEREPLRENSVTTHTTAS